MGSIRPPSKLRLWRLPPVHQASHQAILGASAVQPTAASNDRAQSAGSPLPPRQGACPH